MTPMERIQQQLRQLPPEKQSEVLDFISFLQQQASARVRSDRTSLRQHPAFGSWRGRKTDGVDYQRKLRSEWDDRA